jgi:pSer/pThr/pTyr-binding forkhead associated (FHA) protein
VAPPVAAPVAPPAATAVERARLILVRPDGSEGPTHPLHDGENRIGRETGGVFATDSYLSPHHATFTFSGAMITVRDEGALNGVYVRVERQVPIEIQHGDVFRIGQEILRYESLPAVTPQPDGTERIGAATDGLVGRVSLVTGRDSVGNAFPVPISGIYLGRERGDILFPEDGYVSGLHCQLVVTGHRVSLLDVGSSNGTYVRMRGPRTLTNGDFLLLGQQLFRLQVH